jgi:hypothetical protein
MAVVVGSVPSDERKEKKHFGDVSENSEARTAYQIDV